MANPLFEALAGNKNSGMNPMIQQLMEFKNQMQGDPQQKVQGLLNSGRMTQDQWSCLVQQAQTILSQFGSFLK